MRNLLVALLVAIGVDGAAPASAERPTTHLEFCQFSVPEMYQRLSGHFSVEVELAVDSTGRARLVNDLSSPLMGDERGSIPAVERAELRSCLEKWSLPQARPGELLHATFEWKHEVGWHTLKITGAGLEMTVAISGARCPYGA